MNDRLHHLSACRGVLRHQQFLTPESVLQADRRRLADLHRHQAEIVRLVQAGHPDVMIALFASYDRFDWLVAGITSGPPLRVLNARTMRPGGYEVRRLLELHYRIDDDGADERRAWIALREVLRGVAAAPSQE